MNDRKIAYEVLKKVVMDNQYANLVMRNFNDGQITPFVTEIVYGVLRNNLLFEYQWANYTDKIKNKNRIIFNMAAYEYYFMKTESFALVNEYVELVNSNERKFVNAILRKMVTNEFKDSDDLSIKYSIPLWILNMWKAHYDDNQVFEILKASNQKAKTYYYLNTLKADYAKLDFDYKIINDHVFTSNENLIKSKQFKQGYFQIQDFGASQICEHFEYNSNDQILDLCAAPGGKTAQMAILSNNKANIIACDLHAHRLELLRNKMHNMDIKNVDSYTLDATKLNADFIDRFDIVLADVPCSGLGVLARRPDIKININPDDIDAICKVQKQILNNASKYTKIGAQIIYSTCTLNKKENQRQIKDFLDLNHNFELTVEKTIFPNDSDTDGFYLAKMKRIK